MKLAFTLFKYFPYGGLQRDFMRIATICRDHGHSVDVFTLEWNGPKPDGFNINIICPKRLTNHGKYKAFVKSITPRLRNENYDAVIGFNKMPGLDYYFAADPCYEARVRQLRGRLYRMSGRYRHFAVYENAVFGLQSRTRILILSEAEKPNFIEYYKTPDTRFYLLPPGISRDRMAGDDRMEVRTGFRQAHGLSDEQKLILMIGSGFRTKGLDRALVALAALPDDLLSRAQLYVIGQDNPDPFLRQAKQLGVASCLKIFSGRDDIPDYLAGADLLIHPAYSENTGTVLLEALAAGLPVLTTDVCGYAFHVKQANGGRVLPSPFRQNVLNRTLEEMLQSLQQEQWSGNGINYARKTDLYSMPEVAVDIIERVHRERPR